MSYASQISFGTLTLGGSGNNTVPNVPSRQQVPGTLKYAQNGNLIKTEIPGRAKDWQITINGVLKGSNADTDRTKLIGYDDGQPRAYDDGLVDDDYVIDSLVWTDSGNEKGVYRYTLTLLQWNQ